MIVSFEIIAISVSSNNRSTTKAIKILRDFLKNFYEVNQEEVEEVSMLET